jgi:hypothetical protein
VPYPLERNGLIVQEKKLKNSVLIGFYHPSMFFIMPERPLLAACCLFYFRALSADQHIKE